MSSSDFLKIINGLWPFSLMCEQLVSRPHLQLHPDLLQLLGKPTGSAPPQVRRQEPGPECWAPAEMSPAID